jgi:hypothetical protein
VLSKNQQRGLARCNAWDLGAVVSTLPIRQGNDDRGMQSVAVDHAGRLMHLGGLCWACLPTRLLPVIE